jgi:hypothetical protein
LSDEDRPKAAHAQRLIDATEPSGGLSAALGFADHGHTSSGLEPPNEAGLRFWTPGELRRHTPPAPEWVWEGYVARGWLTLVGGKPKVGKSTTIFAVIDAVANRAPTFLGRGVTGGPVVLVTEEGATTALWKLPDVDDIRVLTREHAWPKPTWSELVAAAMHEADCLGAVMLVVDSFGFWAALPPDAEKDAGAAHAALSPLLEAAARGIAVVLIHHQRKAAGEGGDAFRGSSAIPAAADMLVEIERIGEDAPARSRRLVAVGRWPDTPGVLVFEHDAAERTCRVVGHGDAREDSGVIAWRERLLIALPNGEPGATYRDISGVLRAAKKDWLIALSDLVREGTVESAGRGVKGDPKRFWRTPSDSVSGIRFDPETEMTASAGNRVSGFRSTPVGGTESETSTTDIPSHAVDATRNGHVTSKPPTADDDRPTLEHPPDGENHTLAPPAHDASGGAPRPSDAIEWAQLPAAYQARIERLISDNADLHGGTA